MVGLGSELDKRNRVAEALLRSKSQNTTGIWLPPKGSQDALRLFLALRPASVSAAAAWPPVQLGSNWKLLFDKWAKIDLGAALMLSA